MVARIARSGDHALASRSGIALPTLGPSNALTAVGFDFDLPQNSQELVVAPVAPNTKEARFE